MARERFDKLSEDTSVDAIPIENAVPATFEKLTGSKKKKRRRT
jgi:hypothetical protein